MKKETILVVDDDESLSRIIEYQLKEEGYRVIVSNDGPTGLARVKEEKIALAIIDLQMPGMGGMDTLKEARKIDRDLVMIMITAYGTIETAVAAMKLGAYDYITKPFNKDELKMAVAKALEMRRLRSENVHLRQELKEKYGFRNIIGASPKMQEVYDLVSQVAGSDISVLILGETGTGKELVARAIHYNSPRRNSPFVILNCAAIPDELLESELFGHVKGAFTGAIRDKAGKFEAADTGTIFLDEIGELKGGLQAKLLRVLQDQEFDKVGGTKPIKVDTRIVSATNKDLEAEAREGQFREDLYYRLNVVSIKLPPLRERREDVPLLTNHFLKKHSPKKTPKKLAPETLDLLMKYDWPGNVRELENVIERAIVLGKDKEILPGDLPQKIQNLEKHRKVVVLDVPDTGVALDEVEKELILTALKRTGGNQTRAARFLGISRSALLYRMEKHSLET
ncbi:sigma-54 dependent transcriptional regulator [bacterium]|nr:sigma-54 dependent transcriptional regulator [bacterium]MBU1615441.1 sigma-54 dependent transcriptional regulator [bacterium]